MFDIFEFRESQVIVKILPARIPFSRQQSKDTIKLIMTVQLPCGEVLECSRMIKQNRDSDRFIFNYMECIRELAAEWYKHVAKYTNHKRFEIMEAKGAVFRTEI